MTKLLLFTIALILVEAISSSVSAQTLNFGFSIIGDPTYTEEGLTSITGTITGEIIGLQNNASSTPSDILITSAPAVLGLDASSSMPFSLAANGFYFTGGGTFTVSNGAITADTSYFAYSPYNTASVSFNNAVIPGLTGWVSLSPEYPLGTLANGAGIDGVTFTAESAPEPSTWALLLGGLGLLAFYRTRPRNILI